MVGRREMEGKEVKCQVVGFLVLGLLIGQSTAQMFQLCYVGCFALCMAGESHNPFKCGFQCLKKCIKAADPLDIQTNSHHFCKLGCATSLCTNLSTKDNPNEEKVKSCVDSCSGTCTNAYVSTKN